MKRILGLDIGTASIGWAYIHEAEKSGECSEIKELGVRVVSLKQGEEKNFSEGKAITLNSERRLKRGMRRNLQRYKQRRKQLIHLLLKQGIINTGSILHEEGKNTTFETLRLRSTAVTERVELEQLARILLSINRKRGYRSNRKDFSKEDSSGDYLKNIAERSKKLMDKQQTVGQYFYTKVAKNPHTSLRNEVFYRQDYLDEFERIWTTQQQYHPQLNSALKEEIRDTIIFFQRKLRSQKDLIKFCELEHFEKECKCTTHSDRKITETTKKKTVGLRTAPRSSPLFQEFKIWQILGNIRLRCKDDIALAAKGGRILTIEEKQCLFQELNIKGKLSASKVLKLLNLSSKRWEINYKEVEGNETNAALYKAYLQIAECEGCDLKGYLGLKKEKWSLSDANRPAGEIVELIRHHFEMLGIDTSLLHFDATLTGKAFQQQSAYALWHLLYSYEGDLSRSGNDTLYRLLGEKYGFQTKHSEKLAEVSLLQDYGHLSAKALRKLLQYMPEDDYTTACIKAGYTQSTSKEESNTHPLSNKLELLPKGSLRQPIVEQILNQLINVVNSLMDKYTERDEANNIIQPFHFDEIRIELARELKKNAQERKRLSRQIQDNEKKRKEITQILQTEFNIKNPSRKDIIRYQLYQELKANGYKDLYHNKYIASSQLFSGEIDIEHIIPQSLRFDDGFQNKTLAYKEDNQEKGSRTAFDYLGEMYANKFEEYKSRIKILEQDGNISLTKARNLLMSATDLESGFIERDLRSTQYISKKAKEILLHVTHSVVATSGEITARLREDWQLSHLIKEMNLKKYRASGRTEQIERQDGRLVEEIKDWNKRDDHRHHAVDALTIAFTKHSHIQYFNNLHAGHHYEYAEKRQRIKLPMSDFRQKARVHLERILISHKAKNKVATRNYNKINKTRFEEGKETLQLCLTPRGSLHDKTFYGKRKILKTAPRPLSDQWTMEEVALIAHPQIRNAVKVHIASYPSISEALKNKTLEKNPILYNGEPIKKVVCYEEIFTLRKPIDKDIEIDNILDGKVKEVLRKRLEEYEGNKNKAFSNLGDAPIWVDENQSICIKRVTTKARAKNLEAIHSKRKRTPNPEEVSYLLDEEGKRIPTDYIQTGNNHHIALYRDAKGKIQECSISFMEAMARVNAGLPIIDKSYNKEKGWEFLFTIKKNELFVFPNPETDFDPHKIDLMDAKNKALISPNLYRVQKISSTSVDYMFRHHLETNLKHDIENLTSKRISSLNNLKDCVKVRLNHLGDIVAVGEY